MSAAEAVPLDVAFVESKIDRCQQDSNGNSVIVTRALKTFAEENNVILNAKAVVIRSLGLERYLIQEPRPLPITYRRATTTTNSHRPQQITQRRFTCSAQAQAKKQIPIGARGRKRKNHVNILFIGLTPNIDGHHNQPILNSFDSSHGSAGHTPPMRTYSRTSTPIRGQMLLYNSSPVNDSQLNNVLPNNNDSELFLSNIPVDDGFGQLSINAILNQTLNNILFNMIKVNSESVNQFFFS